MTLIVVSGSPGTVSPLGLGAALVTVDTGEPGALAVAVAEVVALAGRPGSP